MGNQADARRSLAQALTEWRDSGAPVEDVVWAIDDLIEKLIEDRLSQGNK